MKSIVSTTAAVRAIFVTLVAVVVGAVLALGMSAPASAASAEFTLKLTTSAGAPLLGYDVYPLDVAGGAEIAGDDPIAATPVSGRPGYYSMYLISEDTYTLYLGAPGATGTFQYLGGAATLDEADTFVPTATNVFLSASVAIGATLTGKLTSPSGAVLKGAEIDLYKFDGTEWNLDNYGVSTSTGVYTLSNVTPGSYKFRFFAAGGVYSTIYSGGASTLDAATATYLAVGSTVTVNQKFEAGTGSIGGTLLQQDVEKNGTTTNDGYAPNYVPVAIPVATEAAGMATSLSWDDQVQGPATAFPGTGAWKISGLKPGNYVVLVKPNGLYNSEDYLVSGSDGAIGTGSIDLAGAEIYKVTSGHTTSTGKVFAEAAYGLFSGAGISMTVLGSKGPVAGAIVDVISDASGHLGQSANHPWPSILSESSSDSADGSYVSGVGDQNGEVAFYFADGAQLSTDGTGIKTGLDYDLAPGRYAVEVVDPSGVNEPQVFETDLYLGRNSSVVTLDATTTKPGFATPPTLNTSDLQVGTDYEIQGGGSARSDGTDSYEWMRDGKPIYGATTSSYTATGGDLGKHLSVVVTVSSFGYADVTTTLDVGATTDTETVGDAITSDSAPTIVVPTGGATVNTTLTVNPGTWDVDGTLVPNAHYSYIWTGGATGATYTPSAEQVTDQTAISVQVTASQPGFGESDPEQSSNAVTPVALSGLASTKAPTVTKKIVGGVTSYSVTTGSWSQSGLTFDYDWEYGDSSDTKEQLGTGPTIDSSSVTLPAEPAPYPITVQVTAHKPGYIDGLSAVVIAVEGQDTPTAQQNMVVTDKTANSVVASENTLVTVGDKLEVTTPVSWQFDGGPITATSVSYEWYLNNRSIGAHGSSYTVTADDLHGEYLTVDETATFAHAATATWEQSAGSPDAKFLANPTVTVSGYSTVGETLTATAKGPNVPGIKYTYGWVECPPASSCTDPSALDTWPGIAGATSRNYTLTSAHPVAALVFATKSGYDGSLGFSAIIPVSATDQLAANSFPTVTGVNGSNVVVGKKLTAVAPVWSQSGVTNSYTWQTNADGAGWNDVGTGSTYTPTSNDFGDDGTLLRLADAGTKAGVTNGATLYSASNFDVVEPTLTLTKAPVWTATASASVSVSTGTYSAPVTSTSTTYQWFENGTAIAGETNATLADPSAYGGDLIIVNVSETIPGYGNTVTTPVVVQKGSVIVGGVLVTGFETFGSTLEASIVDPFSAVVDEPITLTYQWFANGKAISGTAAQGATFAPPASDIGETLSVQVTGSSKYFSPSSVSATASSTFGKGILGVSSSPPILPSGSAVSGTVLSVALPVFPVAPTLKYAWERSTDSGANWLPISGATKATYTASALDVTDTLRVVVTASKANYQTLILDSQPKVVDYPPALAPLLPPTLTQNPKVGDTITVDPGTWNAPGLTYSYEWLRNGKPIPAVTGTSWTATASSVDDAITVEVTASRSGYPPVTVSSESVSIADGDAATPTVAPTISAVGSGYAVSTGTWGLTGLAFSYQWVLVNGGTTTDATGAGATTDTYTRIDSDSGTLEVVITATREGYASNTVTIVGPTLTPEQ